MKKTTLDFDAKYMQGRGPFEYSVNITLLGQLNGIKIDKKFNSFEAWKEYLDQIKTQELKSTDTKQLNPTARIETYKP